MTTEALDHALLRVMAAILLAGIPMLLGYLYWSVPRREKALAESIVSAIDRSILAHENNAEAHLKASAAHRADRAALVVAHNADPVAHVAALDRALGRIEAAVATLVISIGDIKREVSEIRTATNGIKVAHDILTKDGTAPCETACPFAGEERRHEVAPGYEGPFRRKDDPKGRA